MGCQTLLTAFSEKALSVDGGNDVPNFEQLGSVRMTPQNQILLHSILCPERLIASFDLSKNLVCTIEPHGGSRGSHHELIFLIFDAIKAAALFFTLCVCL